jgi:riboflavin-specific deaminase-like protein
MMAPDIFDTESPDDRALWSYFLSRAARDEAVRPWGMADNHPFWSLYAPIAEGNGDRPFVVAQLGQSLDGRIATPTGCSHYINCPEAIRHLHRLRALVDAVVVGIGTVISDDPQLTVRHATGNSPARVVIDPAGRIPPDARLLAADGRQVFAIQNGEQARPHSVTAIPLTAENGRIDPHAIVASLAGRGYRRLLIEGGAHTVSAFLAAGAVDRLHLCIAPLIIGSGARGIALPPIDKLDSAVRPATAVHRIGDDTLFDCELRATQRGGTASGTVSLDLVER